MDPRRFEIKRAKSTFNVGIHPSVSASAGVSHTPFWKIMKPKIKSVKRDIFFYLFIFFRVGGRFVLL